MFKRWLTTAVLGLAAVHGAEAARAQSPAPASAPPTTIVRTTPPTQVYTTPRPRGILRRFSTRGGIGTTPYLGNSRALGAYGVNYDRGPRPRRVLWLRRLGR